MPFSSQGYVETFWMFGSLALGKASPYTLDDYGRLVYVPSRLTQCESCMKKMHLEFSMHLFGDYGSFY